MLRLLLCLSSVVGLASARVEKLETEKVQACMTSLSTMAANDRMEALGHAWNQLDGDQVSLRCLLAAVTTGSGGAWDS